jgi:hypothetical protein
MKPETSLPSICELLARETEARQARRLSYIGLRPTVVWKRQNEKDRLSELVDHGKNSVNLPMPEPHP